MHLEEKLKSLPSSAGVYQYFDNEGHLLYIGKAKNLKNRIRSYFRFTPSVSPASNLSIRIHKMISQAADLAYIVVQSEHDALILENSLIKQLKPKYNILLRDDKTYPYIYIDLNEDFPRLEMTRKVIKGSHIKYFGPYSLHAREILDSIYDLLMLVQKKSCLKGKKACLFYQINKCHAPCEDKISKQAYAQIVKEAILLLQNPKKLYTRLEAKMLFFSENLLFEEAAHMRDRIEKIKSTQTLSHIDLAKLEDFDIFAISTDDQRACGVMIFIRHGKVISSSHSIIKSSTGFDIDELYRVMLLEFYQKDLPAQVKDILLYETFKEQYLIQQLLSEQYGHKIQIKIPQKGEKKRLVELAYDNANEILRLEHQKHPHIIHQQLQELFKLQVTPYCIEAYDNSHMQGSATVGAMIKWDDGFIKKEYRHYNLSARDEYGQMREMLMSRVESFDKNPPPDLMVIDGGETLRKLAEKIINKNGIYVDIIAIAKEKKDAKAMRAKGKAKDIIYTKNDVFKLSTNDKRLQFVQRLRDESHRFAITFHQKQKRKSDQEITLLQKKGVGEATVKKLLQYFETFENIRNASEEELTKIVGTNIAQNIKNIS